MGVSCLLALDDLYKPTPPGEVPVLGGRYSQSCSPHSSDSSSTGSGFSQRDKAEEGSRS